MTDSPDPNDGLVTCGGCGRPVDPTTPRCEACGYPDASTMVERGWRAPTPTVAATEPVAYDLDNPPWTASPYDGDSGRWGDEQDRSEWYEAAATYHAARGETDRALATMAAGTIANAEIASHFTCAEAEEIARFLFRHAGLDAASTFMEDHAASDDGDDRHGDGFDLSAILADLP